MTLTLERDIHKFRVVQGEAIDQAAGISPFCHDLRRGGEEGRIERGSVRASLPWSPQLPSVTPPTPL